MKTIKRYLCAFALVFATLFLVVSTPGQAHVGPVERLIAKAADIYQRYQSELNDVSASKSLSIDFFGLPLSPEMGISDSLKKDIDEFQEAFYETFVIPGVPHKLLQSLFAADFYSFDSKVSMVEALRSEIEMESWLTNMYRRFSDNSLSVLKNIKRFNRVLEEGGTLFLTAEVRGVNSWLKTRSELHLALRNADFKSESMKSTDPVLVRFYETLQRAYSLHNSSIPIEWEYR